MLSERFEEITSFWLISFISLLTKEAMWALDGEESGERGSGENLKKLLIIQSPRCFNWKKKKKQKGEKEKKNLFFSLHKRPIEIEASSIFRKMGRVWCGK